MKGRCLAVFVKSELLSPEGAVEVGAKRHRRTAYKRWVQEPPVVTDYDYVPIPLNAPERMAHYAVIR
ncbi:MAG: hypothetical protein CME57_06985 [Halieaceae bacterium]|nr:hypothetical protein [Halieaceae bacterium]